MRVKPYYLHHPDLAPGTAHFRLGIARGRARWSRACAAASPGCASRPMCSISPAATARCRSRRAPREPGERAGEWLVDDRDGRAPPLSAADARLTGAMDGHAALPDRADRRRRRAGAQHGARDLPAPGPRASPCCGATITSSPARSKPSARVLSPARPAAAAASNAPASREAVTILALSADDQLNLQRCAAGARRQPAYPHRPAPVQPHPRPQNRAEPAELLGRVAGLAFGLDLCRGGARPVLFPRPAISGARAAP